MTDTAPSPVDTPTSPGTGSAEWPWWWRHRSAIALVAVILVGWVAVVGMVRGNGSYSPVDEMQHGDYVRRVLSGEVVASGDIITFETMADLACRNVAPPFNEAFPRCGLERYRPVDFPHQGVNTAAIHPPTYYAVVGFLGEAIASVTGTEPVLGGARAASGIFLTLGIVLLWWLLAEFAVGLATRFGVTLAVALTPLVLFQSATINPDSTAIAAGAGILLAVVLAERRRIPTWVPALVAGAAMAFKATNVVGVLAAVGYLAVRWWQQREATDAAPADRRRLVVTGVWALAGAAVFSLGFSAYQRSIAIIPLADMPMMEGMRAPVFPWEQLTASVTLTPTGTSWNPAQLSRPINVVILTVVAFAIAGLAAAALALGPRGGRIRAVAAASLAAVVATGPLFDVANYVLTQTWTPIPARYGIAAVPAMVVAAAWVLDSRRLGRWLAVGAGAATAVTTVAGIWAPFF